MSFIWPWLLLSLALLPLSVGYYVRLGQQRQLAAERLGPLGLVQSQGKLLGRQRHTPPLFYLGGLACLLISLARPETVIRLPRVEGTVILVFDISNSMRADDMEPTRLEAAKAAAQTFVAERPSTVQVGVVAFGNGGLVVQPPTAEEAAVLETIERLTPDGGTSLGHGIFSALNAIAGEPLDTAALAEGIEQGGTLNIGKYPSAVIVLLTDGENTAEPDPLAVAQIAAEAGVRIFPVGLGSAQGAVLELDGFQILTQLNEQPLQEIASLTNGTYFQASDTAALDEVYSELNQQLTIRGEKTEVTALLAGLGMLLFALGGGLSLLWFGRIP